MSGVLVTGSHGPLGRRVCHLVAADPTVDRLVRVDALPSRDAGELKRLVEGLETVVHLGSSDGPEFDGTGAAGVDVEATQALFDAAGSVGVTQFVLLSSAMVYGAWPNNPIPLTEDSPLRPNPESMFAVAKAEVERLAHEWRSAHPGSRVALLRPAIAVSEETAAWMSRSLWSTAGVLPEDLEPPGQFLHLDDLASAVDLARRHRLDGAYNAAPDGWIPPEGLRALAGPAPRLRLPAPVAARLARWRWRLGLTTTPPGVLPYTVNPWVVANDRLRREGWVPTSTNEEAFVAGVEAGPLADLGPRHRQHLALGAAAAVVVAAGAVVVALVLRRRRRR